MSSLSTLPLGPTSDVFDPNGDVFFNISSSSLGRQRLLRVSSQVLRLTSPVFNAMLRPTSPFKEGIALRANHTAVVALSGDDEDALVVLMNAAHQNAHLIPTSVSVDLLYEIAVLCDKYDMAPVMCRWPRRWANKLTPFARHHGLGRMMAVAWVFGLNNIFAQVTREFVYCMKPEADPIGQCHSDPEMDIHIVHDDVEGRYLPIPLL